MNFGIVKTLIAKDITLFFRNRFFGLVTALALVSYMVIYFVMPGSVDEKLRIGLYASLVPPVIQEMEEDGLEIEVVNSEEALKEGVIEGQFEAGVALPIDILEKLMAGEKASILVYFPSDAPQEFKESIAILLREAVYLQSGQDLDIELSQEVLGVDMSGMQIPPRDRMLPLFAVMIVMMETLGLASLISEELQGRTIQALLVTPVTVGDLFVAKGITGVGLAFGQAALFMAVTGGLNQQPVVTLVVLLLGAVLATAIAFLIASVGKDMMSVMAWGIPFMILLIVPAFGVMFPGAISGWVKAIPSYYLVDAVHLAANFDFGWSVLWQDLLIILGFNTAFTWLGIIALRRKVR